jgi:hypothetical protein
VSIIEGVSALGSRGAIVMVENSILCYPVSRVSLVFGKPSVTVRLALGAFRRRSAGLGDPRSLPW